jgi:hypothetical protein
MEKLEVAPQEIMLNLISGFWIARSIYLAAQIGVADAFDEQPKTIAQLAAATNTEPRSLYRLLRALASVGIFTEVSDQCFALTPLAATLKSNSSSFMRYVAMAQMGYVSSLGWSHGVHSLKTGEKTFDAVTGRSVWDHQAQHPEEARIFSQSRNGTGAESALAVAASYDFSGMNTIVEGVVKTSWSNSYMCSVESCLLSPKIRPPVRRPNYAQGQHGIYCIWMPSCPWNFEALLGNIPMSAFNFPRTDG